MIKPRYLGDLVRYEPLREYVLSRFDDARDKCDRATKEKDMNTAAEEFGKMKAYQDIFNFLIQMVKY